VRCSLPRRLSNRSWVAGSGRPTNSKVSRTVFLRPKGPAFSSHVREGVDIKDCKIDERRRCGTRVRIKQVSALRA